MNDSYVECLIKSKKNSKAVGLRIFLIILALLGAAAAVLFNPWISLVSLGSAIGVYVVSGYINVEYEYLYFDREITIDRIYNQEKRKRIGVYSLDRVEVIAPIRSHHLDNFGKVSEHPLDYGVGTEEKPDRRYIMFYEGKQQIIFNPNEEMIKMMKNVAPRKIFNE